MPDSRWAWAEVIKGKAINGRYHKVEWEFYNKIYVEGMGKLYTPDEVKDKNVTTSFM
ncbi:MAG: hypothetical protein WAJ84_06100 [Candidatus Rhabdochlamydia sp.]